MSRAWLIDHACTQLRNEQQESEVPCKICEGASTRYDMLDFERSATHIPFSTPPAGIPVVYRKCSRCGFIFTRFFDGFTGEQWREHVYNDAYGSVDPEYTGARAVRNAQAVPAYFGRLRGSVRGLDYGGGNGMTAKHLRDAGWNFACYDPFGLDETSGTEEAANFCTSFEVFEHFPNPVASMQNLLSKVTSGPLLIFIGTWLNDASVNDETRLSEWVYAGPRNGHISLYSRRALSALAQKFGLELTSIHAKGHLMSRGHDTAALESVMRWGRYRNVARRLLRV